MNNDSDVTYLRSVDTEAMQTRNPDGGYRQVMVGSNSGSESHRIQYKRSPSGRPSGAGYHVHDYEKSLCILEGEMSFEIEGKEITAHPGDVVFIPAGAAHRNWNSGTSENVCLQCTAPIPDPSKPSHRTLR